MNWRRWVWALWIGSWAGAGFLAFMQAYFMSRQLWPVLVAVGVTAAFCWVGRVWGNAVARRGVLATSVLRVVALLHLLPLLMQALGRGSPRLDNLLLAVIGWSLLELAGWSSKAGAPRTT